MNSFNINRVDVPTLLNPIGEYFLSEINQAPNFWPHRRNL